MKRTLTVISLLSCFIGISQKTLVGLQSFEAVNTENWKESEAVTEKVKEVFVKSKRFTVLDRTEYAETRRFTEKEVQKNLDYINGFVVKQGRSKGAQNIIGGKLLTLKYEKTKKGNLKCIISFSLSVDDVETGELMYSEVISQDKISLSINPTLGIVEEEALINSLVGLEKKIDAFIEDYVPFYTEVIQIEEIKKNAAKTVLINGGVDNGIKKNDKFGLYQVSYIETSKGKKRREQEIAVFKISKVEGDLSIGNVVKGGEALLIKFDDKDLNLVCKSLKKGLLDI